MILYVQMIDTHAHLQFPPLSTEKPEEILLRAQAQEVNTIVNVASDLAGSQFSVTLAEKHPQVYAAVGIHPHDAESALKDPQQLATIEKLLQHKKVVALGECGLDYYKNYCPKDIQQEIFEKQIMLAIKYQKPLIIHNRESDTDVFERIKDLNYPKIVFHCFAGNVEYAKKVLDLGCYLSFTGNITFPNNKKGPSVIEYAPLDRIMTETDCPFMTPVPYRGKPNEPAYCKQVGLKIAEIKNLSFEEVDRVTMENAGRFFNLPPL